MSRDTETLVPPGLPRPRSAWDGRPSRAIPPAELPVPWLVGSVTPDGGDWTVFDDGRCRQAHTKVLCQVCGEALGVDKVLLSATSAVGDSRASSGPACHPRCALLTVRHCPHFHGWDPALPVGWLYRGAGRGYQRRAWGAEKTDPHFDPEAFTDELYADDVVAHPDAVPVTFDQIRELVTAGAAHGLRQRAGGLHEPAEDAARREVTSA